MTMTCAELAELIPDLVDGTLSPELQAEAEIALALCPEQQREREIARQIRRLLTSFQAQKDGVLLPAGFEARLLERIRQQIGPMEWLDLSSEAFGLWLREMFDLLAGLARPGVEPHRIQQRGERAFGLELLDLSTGAMGTWMRELIDLVGGLAASSGKET